MDRIRLLDISWFRDTRRMAVADKVWAEGIGVVSYQPLHEGRVGLYEMMDVNGNFHYLTAEQLFWADETERRSYSETRQGNK